jgi:hypothetical protein
LVCDEQKPPPVFKNTFPFVHNPSFKLVTQNLQKRRVVGRTVQKGHTVGRTAPKMQQNPHFFHKFFLFLSLQDGVDGVLWLGDSVAPFGSATTEQSV